MEQLTSWLEQPAVRILAVLLTIILLVIVIIVLFTRERLRTRNALHAMARDVSGQLAAFEDALSQDMMADRDAVTHTLRGMNDSIVQLMGEMGRIQQQQLDSFGRQTRMAGAAGEERMERMRQTVEERLGAYDRQLAVNERRMGELRQTLETGMQRLLGENEKKLEQIRVTVDEKLNATLDKRLGESFRTVSERLEQVYKGLGEMQTLAIGVGDLKRVLTGVKTRGVWGEVQLGALLEQVLAPGQYAANVQVISGSTERVEYAVLLPGHAQDDTPVYLPIDAKYPMEDYQRLLDATDAGDKAAVEAASRALETAIRTEAKRIREKYIAPPGTTDFALMFLPIEGLFAEALRRDGMIERLQREYRVVVTGPTTLMALLNSLQMGFRTIAIEKRTSEVWELLGVVKTEFGRFAQLLSKTQQKLRQASDSIEVAARKTRTIERRLRSVQALSEGADPAGLIDLEEEAQLALGLEEEELD